MLARPAKRRRAWLGLLLASLTPSSAAPTVSLPVHWCVHDLFSTLHHPAVPASRRGTTGPFLELP
ncbi:hypothetical protein UB43_00375 [Pseudomonas sp. 21]|nr:hypothetical protein UB43_00375 [Pseudomonas sp. 21]